RFDLKESLKNKQKMYRVTENRAKSLSDTKYAHFNIGAFPLLGSWIFEKELDVNETSKDDENEKYEAYINTQSAILHNL
ncbi:MAG: hypothetical protein ACJAXL_001239, partial [Alphaproteobacteria bacterium]